MLVPVITLPLLEEQAFDSISDEDFFVRFPSVTHRTRPWMACLTNDRGWLVVSRRDGFRMRVRRHIAPIPALEVVILTQPPADSDLSFDHGTELGITGAARHAR